MPKKFPKLPPIKGVHIWCGRHIKSAKRNDLLLVCFDKGTKVAGVFTSSKVFAYNISLCRQHIKNGQARGLVVNAGNANAFTGQKGAKACHKIVGQFAQSLKCAKGDIFMNSTGVIGVPLLARPIISKIKDHIPNDCQGQKKDIAKEWLACARAIMTTDTYPKLITKKIKMGDADIKLNGIAKGSGMVAPSMATMLAYLFTDANISPPILQKLLNEATQESFNAITIDGDISTSDSVMLFATAKAKNAPFIKTLRDKRLLPFRVALKDATRALACQIVKDGEGASKFIEIDILGAPSKKIAHETGLLIANSPLVKTAIAGEDPNWGRIIGALGKSETDIRQDKLRLYIGGAIGRSKGSSSSKI